MQINKKDFWSGDWWDEKGHYSILNDFNIARLKFIKRILTDENLDLSEADCLDIGCGGGILIHALLNLNVKSVLGIDGSFHAINAAKNKIFKNKERCSFVLCKTSSCIFSNVAKKKNYFDIIFCMDVLEHIENFSFLLEAAHSALKPNGIFFASTINRNFSSLLLVKFVAEYIARIVKKNTHSWSMFIKPEELVNLLEKKSFFVKDISGFNFNPMDRSFALSSDLDLNYIVCAKKVI